MEKKKFYLSKTFWVNLIALVAIVAFGLEEVPPEYLASGLAFINLVLRFITGKPVEW